MRFKNYPVYTFKNLICIRKNYKIQKTQNSKMQKIENGDNLNNVENSDFVENSKLREIKIQKIKNSRN